MASNRPNVLDVLVIDDEEAVCWSLQRAFQREGWSVAVASSAEQGLKLCQERPPRVVLLDIRLPGMDGLTAMATFQKVLPRAPLIMMTAYGQLSTAVQAIEQGAFDYLTKPFDLDDALHAVRQALYAVDSRTEPAAAPVPADDLLVGVSPPMQEVFKRIALAAQADTTVLVTGESGVGKDLVAQAIHRNSRRRNGPFIPIHVGALTESLVESEMFGHVRGSFTGASDDREGLLCLADGGTVFLDEVAEVPLPIQMKLLRVLEQGEVLPVGSRTVRHPNIRIIAATNRRLNDWVDQEKFRADLYYRLRVFEIHVPPLRERREDIPMLVRFFASRCVPPVTCVPEETIEYLTEQEWGGNVRQLRNAVEAAAVLARQGPLLVRHLQQTAEAETVGGLVGSLAPAVRQWVRETLQHYDQPPIDLYEQLLQAVEPALLSEVLRRTDGNRQEAAAWLGLNRATVRKKLQQHGLG